MAGVVGVTVPVPVQSVSLSGSLAVVPGSADQPTWM